MLSRDDALSLLDSFEHRGSQLHHALETEAVMRGLARNKGYDQDLWGLTGLLHDLDFPQTRDNPAEHGPLGARELEGKLPPEALQAIKAHNSEYTGIKPESPLDFALRCGETVTGLVSANALVRPQGMAGMKPKSLKKKMKDKSFAANVSRERINECQQLGLETGEFFQIAIEAIEEIADQVEL
ncbi:MAG: HDIG domain-containing protein [Desulfohalobiaceae bacterium]|nr:HDIG domain-containing protein [Desulfohalobiaceae bacterium]